MSQPSPRRHQSYQPPPQDAYAGPIELPEQNHGQLGHAHSHSHGQGHGRTRSRQLQVEAQQQGQRQRPRHQHQPSPHHHHNQHQQHLQQPRPTSDYESDTAPYMASHDAPQPDADADATAAGPTRSNTELNLAVLQRYLPSITTVLSIAANAVVYTFQPPSEWKRTNMEGTMFVCSQRKVPGPAGETGCLFILNRKGLQNLVVDLDNVDNFELAGDLLIFKLDEATHQLYVDAGEAVNPHVLGLWTYAEEQNDRETNAVLIHDMWRQALDTRDVRAKAAASNPATSAALAEAGPAAEATGSLHGQFVPYNGDALPIQT
ncbi:PH domain-like protein [Nemania sp. FL0916]|nr:PH domain-like protein [Nemania sp. FL0916]